MQSNEIRTRFLEFFAKRGHRIVSSSSLVPANDPTLLFSNAGMNQFKDVFLGREKRDYSRATSSQKCVRAGGKHNDLEQVGRTARHHTFFEMLGNFSFGDYFKNDAIPWAWELITQEFGIPADKLYVTIFEGKKTAEADIPLDQEAYDRWISLGVPKDRIFALGMKDNFWQMGDTGPCGPCSEIHYDMGVAASDEGHTDCEFPCDCGRYVELWNLVFMQFNRDENGAMTPLPKPSIDTGAGLERLAAVLQGKLSNFETDLFRPLIDEAASLAKVEYGANHDTDVSLRIIADHARATTFLISDGVLPSNEGRGYVLRLIMRRALYHGQTLGLNEPFLYKISGHVVEMMKGAYPELIDTAPHIAKAIKIEEEKYAHTTRVGLTKLDDAFIVLGSGAEIKFHDWRSLHSEFKGEVKKILEHVNNSARKAREGVSVPEGISGVVDGDDVFELHDTFGLRPDFVDDIVSVYGLGIDRGGYSKAMNRQRLRSRDSWKAIDKKIAGDLYRKEAERHPTRFLGYDLTRSEARVLVVTEKEEKVPFHGVAEVEVILDQTPFFAESGGQVGDTGWLYLNGEVIATVEDTYSPITTLIVHKIKWSPRKQMKPDEIIGAAVIAEVDLSRRAAIRRNHTATHLLHAALRKTLGTHVKQAGSLVAPERLRFDFSHYAGLAEQDVLDIEDLVNQHVLANEEMQTQIMDIDSAVATGAMALFGEKYGDQVRVVSVGDGSYSRELCGGTHVRRTGDIGLFKIVSNSSVAAGTRRIEALTGMGVLDHLRRESQTLAQASQALRSKPGEMIEAIEKLTESEKKLRKELETQQMKSAASAAGDLVQQTVEIKGVKVLAARVEVTDRGAMRQMIDDLRGKLQSGVIVLGSAAEGRVTLIAAVTKDLTNQLDAGKIVKQAATYVEGSGGGRKDLAEAGGKDPSGLDRALQAVPGIIEQML
jgi:alanyl-tRNA synthetase